MTDAPASLHVVALGTYDKVKPRTRILLRGLKENGVRVTECHNDVWGEMEDRSQIRGLGAKLAIVGRYLVAYPVLIWRYLRCPQHDAVLVGYLGLFDVLVLWPFIRARRVLLVWDVFLSLYDTVVEDRGLLGRYHPAAGVLWLMEWLALRLVDLALMDTKTHADYLQKTYHCLPDRVGHIFVGAEPERFDLVQKNLPIVDPGSRPGKVLFYGQFIPLHGIETIVRAAKMTEGAGIEWTLIGKGQETGAIQRLIDELRPENLDRIEWVEYEDLIEYLAGSHIVLGIFGTTRKAQRVIPNKVFQIVMAGRPLITADTPAMRELFSETDQFKMIPPGDADALAGAVSEMMDRVNTGVAHRGQEHLDEIYPVAIGMRLSALIQARTGA